MASINDAVKQIVKRSLEAQQLTTTLFGNVTLADPLEVTIDQRFTLSADFLVVPEHLQELRLTIGETEYEIRRGLHVGDKLILVRSEGGLQYVVAGRLTI